MKLIDLIRQNRSYRRFYQEQAISMDDLRSMMEAARLSGSGRNLQPLKYILCNTPERNAQIFEALSWAGYLTDWDGPVEGERPSAYMIQLLDTSIAAAPYFDPGICAQSILLQAVELGYGGCMIGSFKSDVLGAVLHLPESLTVVLVIALGKPKEEVVIAPMIQGDVKYWRDEHQVHHVPKRSLDELIIV
ncbi:MAG: nitroreductase family protein [Bacteroidales bacterium]|nr:nitroreductase family protein [Bacteroidales bacterium]